MNVDIFTINMLITMFITIVFYIIPIYIGYKKIFLFNYVYINFL